MLYAEDLLEPWRHTDLLKQALRHRSLGANHNERLEFIGDAVLSIVIAEALYKKFPQAPEGDLTKMRSRLVSGDTLADLAREYQFNTLVELGAGERKSRGHEKESILSGLLEAIFGAIYFLTNLTTVQQFILTLYRQRLEHCNSPNQHLSDPKTRLQEYLQSQKLPLPQYVTKRMNDDKEKPLFHTCCHAAAYCAESEGYSIRKAEQKSAASMLEKLNL